MKLKNVILNVFKSKKNTPWLMNKQKNQNFKSGKIYQV